MVDKKPQIRWNYERSEDKHFDDNNVRYYFVIYNASYHDSIKKKILDQFTGFDFFPGFVNYEEFYGNRENTVMRYRVFSFETSRVPDKFNWDKVTSMRVERDKNLSQSNKKGIENYVSDLFNRS